MEREQGGFIPEKFQKLLGGKHEWADRFRDNLFWVRTGASVSIVVAALDLYVKPDFWIVGISVATSLACFQKSREIIEKRANNQASEDEYLEVDEEDIYSRGENIILHPLDGFSNLILGEDSPS